MLASFGLSQTKIYNYAVTGSCAYKVCLKRWDLHYHSTLQLLNLPHFSLCHRYLELTTMYNIAGGHMYSPSNIIVQCNLPSQFYHTNTLNFTRPFVHANYNVMYHSFVPSAILSLSNLLDSAF